MNEADLLAEVFERQRPRLRAVAYRMLGSLAEAEDAVQESWLRLAGSDAQAIKNVDAWLTTVVGRICLDMLRSRTARREDPLELRLPDPVVAPLDGASDPEHEALLADSVGLALLVVLETLTPAERLAFVLHDMFAVPFDAIASIVGRTPDATKMLASRARRRVRGAAPDAEPDPARQREVVEAYLAAARAGDFEALLAVLDPDVLLRADLGGGAPMRLVRGSREVAASALAFRAGGATGRVVSINGAPGLLSSRDGRVAALLAFTIRDGRVAEIDIVADPARLAGLAIA